MAPTIGGSPMGRSGTTAASLSSTNAMTVVMMWSRRPPPPAIPVCGVGSSLGLFAALSALVGTPSYWWAPLDRLNAHAATVLGAAVRRPDRRWLPRDGPHPDAVLCDRRVRTRQHGAGNRVCCRSIREAAILDASTMADRRGRRPLLLFTGVSSCVTTVLGGFSPTSPSSAEPNCSLSSSTALGIIIAIMAVEEMPTRSRAWAASVLTLSAGLGSGHGGVDPADRRCRYPRVARHLSRRRTRDCRHCLGRPPSPGNPAVH